MILKNSLKDIKNSKDNLSTLYIELIHVIEYLFYVNWNLGNNISNNANIDH
jgi:hypothetical protein